MKPSRPTMKINGWTVPLTMRTGVGCLVVVFTLPHDLAAGAHVTVEVNGEVAVDYRLEQDAHPGDEITGTIPREGPPQ